MSALALNLLPPYAMKHVSQPGLFQKLAGLLVFLFTLSHPSPAQPKIITIDTLTGVPSETLPFHRPFFLKLLTRKDNPVAISLFDHKRNKTLDETIIERTQERIVIYDADGNPKTVSRPKNYNPRRIPEDYFFIRKEGEKAYLYINFRDNVALQPSTQYTIAIYYKAHPDAPKVFRYLHKADSLPATSLKARALLIRKAVDEYNKIAEKSKKGSVYFGMTRLSYPDSAKLVTASGTDFESSGVVKSSFKWIPVAGNPGSLTTYDSGIIDVKALADYHQKNVKPLFKADSTLKKTLDSAVQVSRRTSFHSSSRPLLDTLGWLFLNYDTLSASKLRDMFTHDNNRVLRTLEQLKSLIGQTHDDILGGLRPLLCEFCVNTNKSNLDGRIKNIEETVADLNRVRLLNQLLVLQKTTLADLDRQLTQLLTDLAFNRAVLKKMVDNQTKINKAIADNGSFMTTDFTGGDTYIFNFETRTKHSLVPDFGLVSDFPLGRGSNYLLMPFVGATINFAPLDRDVPYHLIRNKTCWQNFGLTLGYTLVSLKDSTANPPRDNFFEKSAFVTGLSYRLSNTVKLTGGFTWYFKREDSLRKLTSFPVIGISFDLDVKKYLSDLVGAITSSKAPSAKTTATNSPTP